MFGRIKAFFFRKTLDSYSKQTIEKIERIVGHKVSSASLYLKALRHRSYVAEKNLNDSDSYEQLEFLGDAVLDVIVSEIIYHQYPSRNEGFMTQLRAKVVKGENLAYLAQRLQLGELIAIGNRVKNQGIEKSESVLADTFEALIGAIYIDLGFDTCTEFVTSVLERFLDFDELIRSKDNYKSILLEYAQSRKYSVPYYEIVKETGPGHDKTFSVQVTVADHIVGYGSGKNKKKAEQAAAMQALHKLQQNDGVH